MIKIDKAVYQGYIWYSDKTVPTVVDGEFSLELADDANPFVVEGMLYDADKGVSHSIRYVDGAYVTATHRVDENDFNSADVDVCEYPPFRMPGVAALVFLKYWTPVADPLCCGMPTLVNTRTVFAGFK